MWDDVIIGKPISERSNSAVKIFGLSDEDRHGFYQNSQSYWISDCILGLGCTIYKHTKEGEKLTKLITGKASLNRIQTYVDVLIIKRVDSKLITEHIEETQRECFRQGQESKSKEIRTALGIEGHS